MKNKKTIFNVIAATALGLLLTACGDDGGSSSNNNNVVTTLSCTNTAVFNQTTNIWTVSSTDTRQCNPVNTVNQNTTCGLNEFNVRVPIGLTNQIGGVQTVNGQVLSNGQFINQPAVQPIFVGNTFNTNGFVNNINTSNITQQQLLSGQQFVNNTQNFHQFPGSFSNTCISQFDPTFQFVRNQGSYFFLDSNLLFNTYQVQFGASFSTGTNFGINSNGTRALVGVTGAALIALALFGG